ncbi:unnamed protein product [Nippostrongylus brasiliensis]|uniref:Uncharacterized protein n=1 Tax=Nippostrongylus brasiliensis TaxID=27835 RepID=A0A0N4YKL2_NIPBR|nr:unnamed protein product [Nippostrongylus brasiliensis]
MHLLEASNGTAKQAASCRSPTSPRNRKSNGGADSNLSSTPNGHNSNGRVAPFSNPTLMNILVALLAGEQTSTCLVTAQMNMICQDIGVQPRTCSEVSFAFFVVMDARSLAVRGASDTRMAD